MVRLVQKLHLLAGLQACVALVLFGVAGLSASFEGAHGEGEGEGGREHAATRTYDVAFEAPAGASDRRVADLVFERLRLPMTSRIPDFGLKHDAAGNLALDFHTPNGKTSVSVLRERRTLRVQEHRVGLAKYLSNMHGMVGQIGDRSAPRAIRAWSVYVELSILSLFFLVFTGIVQWLLTRARERLGQLSFAAGVVACALAYLWMR